MNNIKGENKKIICTLKIVGLAALVGILILVLSGSVSAVQEWQITNDSANQKDPEIYGDIIVWADSRNGNWDIYMYNLSTRTETQITKDSSDQLDPAIYGDIVVWTDRRQGNLDIYMYNLSTNTETWVTINRKHQFYPAIYGNIIVWTDQRNYGTGDIYIYDISSGVERRITTNAKSQWYSKIYGDVIVYQDCRNGIETVETVNCTPGNEFCFPGDTYYEIRACSNTDIYMYDLSTKKETPVAAGSGDEGNPAIYKDIIVYQDNKSGQWDIYTYNISSGTTTQLTNNKITVSTFKVTFNDSYRPAIYEDIIVWTQSQVDVYYSLLQYYSVNIYKYNTTNKNIIKVTNNSASFNAVFVQEPSVYGNKIVWYDDRTGNNDIYLYSPAVAPPICYTNTAGTCLINAGENCTCINQALNDTNCNKVRMQSDINNWSGTCVDNPQKFNNKIFDCQGHMIDGNNIYDSWPDAGIYLNGKTGNTIKNCVITDFYYGIYLYSPLNNTIQVNEISNNSVGIYSQNSNAIINSNIVCGNINLDFNSTSWLLSSGYNNTCDKPDGWNDTGAAGCKNKCITEVKTYSVPLNSGWNLVSLPLTPKNTSIKSVLSSVEGKYTKVGAWTGGAGKHYIPGFPFNTLNEINEKMGFWIKMNKTGTLTVEGNDPSDRKITLQVGWNLVGYLSTNKTLPLTTALSSISGKYTKVGAWINGTGKHYIPGFPFNTLINMSEGYGYWIKMNASGVLEY